MLNEEVAGMIDKLRLYGMSGCLSETLGRSEKEGLSVQEVLYELLVSEYQERERRSMANRIRQAKLPWDWTLDSFPFAQQPGVNKSQILSLAQLGFIERHENVILIGKPGTGKTGLAVGLLKQALINGYRGKFYNAQVLLDELYASLADRSTSRLLNQLSRYDVLLIDELGYLTLQTAQVNIFFKLIDLRYQKKSTIITTNLDYPVWYDVFKQKDLVDALLDRFRHYCTTLRIEGNSLRKPIENKKPSNQKEKKKAQ